MDHNQKDVDFLKKLTLLYVEDDPDTRTQLARFLQKRTGQLVTAENGMEGKAAFRAHQPALIITDIQMPGMDGLTMARQIREMDAAVPIIVTTAFEQTDYLLRAIDIGVDKFVAKPVDPTRLQEAMLACAHRLRIEAETADLEAQNRQLQKAESLGRMAGAIAHHFNNQLQTVMGNLEMAMELTHNGSELSDFLKESMQAAIRASEVSSTMLTYLGQTPARRESRNLSRICRNSLPVLMAALPRNVVLEADLCDDCPEIHANENQVRQVLTHLTNNAGEAIDTGGGTIHLSVRMVSAAKIPSSRRFPIDWMPQKSGYVRLEIRDTGSGISESDIEKIFDPFFTSKFTGRGLGLAVVLGIVRAHGGAVTVESRPGKGSRFSIFFPPTSEAVPARPPESESEAPDQENPGLFPEIEKCGIVLLVEDEEPVRKMTRILLARLGITVLEARDGVEAVEMLRQYPNEIGCVLCDLTMPRMDGWKTLAALRKISPRIPVILSSGFEKEQVMAGIHNEWPNGFLGKPYQLKDLRKAIRHALTDSPVNFMKEFKIAPESGSS